MDKNITAKEVIYTFLILISIVYTSYAQINSPEKIHLHIDRPFYLIGETIWYKLYTINYHEQSDHSEIVYVNVHEKNGSLLIQQKLRLTEGKANGSIDIPLSWNEDFYYITCFTKWNLQFGNEGLSIHEIPVYNFSENEESSSVIAMDQVDSIEIQHQENIKLDLTKKSYHRREKAIVKITNPDGLPGNCSVSIYSLVSLNDHKRNIVFDSSVSYEVEAQDSKEKELTIEGRAMDPDSGNPVISALLSVYKVGSEKFYRTTSKEGIVRARIDDFNEKATFQLFNMNPYQPSTPDFKLKLTGEKLMGLENKYSPPPRNERINNYLTNSRLSRKIHEIFEERTLDSLQGKQFVPIPFKADKVYQMEKYQSMKTLEEFLREIVIYVDFIKKDGNTTVRLKNKQTQHYFMEKPWYLVDGYLTGDEELVLSIPFKNLSRIEIFNTNNSILGQLETVMIRSGMIAVYTDNFYLKNITEEGDNIFEFKGFSISKDFVGIAQLPSSEARENPNFNSLLYWNPNVELSNNSQMNFVTSDLLGNFIIRVEGITESGQRLSGSQTFSVNN